MAQQLADAFLRILALHRVDFPPAQHPTAPEPAVPDRAAIYAHYEKHALAGIGMFSGPNVRQQSSTLQRGPRPK
ncbi:MAG TPA: hypothetical protein VI011_25550 [Asanoa sp.]